MNLTGHKVFGFPIYADVHGRRVDVPLIFGEDGTDAAVEVKEFARRVDEASGPSRKCCCCRCKRCD